MITINNLTISYGTRIIIDNLALNWTPGAIHGLLGLNGSGKTTLLNTLYGLKSADTGTINFNGKILTKKNIGYLETSNFFYSKITGLEYLKLFQTQNKSFDIEQWNYLFHLPLNSFIETYSTGMRKKLAFLAIICLDKPIIVLDEPFNGVDMETSQTIKIIIKSLKDKGKTVIITSHILESLTTLCDTITYIDSGKIIHIFIKDEFLSIESKVFGNFNSETETAVKKLLNP